MRDFVLPPAILLVDDQRDVLDALTLLLEGEGFLVTCCTTPSAAFQAAQRGAHDLALIDLNYARDTSSGKEGLSLLASLLKLDPDLPVVVMTAWGSVELAVETMRAGARDYIAKPWNNERLVHVLRTQIALRHSRSSERRLKSETDRAHLGPELIAASAPMQAVVSMLERVAPSDANILITGEHGTGKEVVARWVHAHSLRAGASFIAVNAGGLSEGVFDSELFGHVKGAFTDAKTDRVGCFEMADEGTLFLDEIGNMPLAQQAKLLRVLQTGEFHPVGSSKLHHSNVRILAATNVDLAAAVTRGTFREDLLYRLNTVETHLPPLRERVADILPLADFFLRKEASRYRKPVTAFTPSATTALTQHAWPGNVRELGHVIERAVLLASHPSIESDDLLLKARAAALTLDDMTLEEVERALIQKALARHDGNATKAGEALGLSRSAMYRRLQQYGIKAT